jgi:integrase/recombinase XerD
MAPQPNSLPAPSAPRPQSELLAAPDSLLQAGEAVARRASAPATRVTYASAYRAFAVFLTARLGRTSRPGDLTEAAVAEYRDTLEQAGRAGATVVKQLCALRRLAAALRDAGADPSVDRVRANGDARRARRALTRAEFERLLAIPDRRTHRGRRDLAILLLLGASGLRRSEVCALRYEDLEPLGRHPSPDRCAAIAERSEWMAHVRQPERGRARAVDLSAATIDALRAWTQARPHCDSDHVFVSLARNRPPAALAPRAINTLVAAYAAKAGLPENRCSPHVLRHTFCGLLADRGHGLEVIAELAGHADLRTAKGYVHVSVGRRAAAVHDTFSAGSRRGQLASTDS